jgi:DNA-binding NtrC family response regulator
MARVKLEIGDPANLMTLKAVLEADGNDLVEDAPEVLIADDPLAAIPRAREVPTLLVSPTSGLRAAIAAMRQGVFGYILVPFQPGEAELMVRRAAHRQPDPVDDGPPEPLAEVERKHIQAALRYCRNNRAKAARLLGIGRNTLWRKLKALEQRGGSGPHAR